jgi:hypothetical protein
MKFLLLVIWACSSLGANPIDRDEHTAVLTPKELVICGGWSVNSNTSDGYFSDTWSLDLNSSPLTWAPA